MVGEAHRDLLVAIKLDPYNENVKELKSRECVKTAYGRDP